MDGRHKAGHDDRGTDGAKLIEEYRYRKFAQNLWMREQASSSALFEVA